jgi:hypothetical protein
MQMSITRRAAAASWQRDFQRFSQGHRAGIFPVVKISVTLPWAVSGSRAGFMRAGDRVSCGGRRVLADVAGCNPMASARSWIADPTAAFLSSTAWAYEWTARRRAGLSLSPWQTALGQSARSSRCLSPSGRHGRPGLKLAPRGILLRRSEPRGQGCAAFEAVALRFLPRAV